jgi:hypothetical protein
MITQKLAAQVIIDILNSEMNMPPNSVWLREQNRTIPNDDGLYIAVGLVGAQTLGNVTEMQTIDTIGNGAFQANAFNLDAFQNGYPQQFEVNQLQQQEAIQIDIFSSAKNNLALFRNWEVIAALQSFFSQQQQEANSFKIFRIPRSFVDTSSAEGGSMLQRFTITIMAFVWYRKQKAMGDYYDDFTVRVDDENTIGNVTPLLEFEITENTPPPFGDAI